MLSHSLDGKRQDILIEAVPGARRMAALADARITPAAPLQALQSAAQAQGIDLLTFAPGKPAETVPAIEAAKAAGAGAINFLVLPLPPGLNSFIFKTLEDMDSLYFIRVHADNVAAEGEAVL